MDNVIFFHMNQLGDLLFSLPVLSAARREWPGKKITCVARAEHLPVIEAAGLADTLVPKCLGCVIKKTAMVINLRKQRFDKGVFFSESPETMMIGAVSAIKERIGFSTASMSFLLTGMAPRTGVPSMKNNKVLGEKAGLRTIADDYASLVKVPEGAANEAAAWLEKNSINPGRLVIISPGASRRRRNKSWPVSNWKAVIQRLAEKGWSPVLTGAPSEKEELDNLLMGAFYGARVFIPDGGILSLAALMAKARLFVGIDSGAMHLAASMNTKVVALFGGTDPSQVGPMPLEKNFVIKKDRMSDISAEEVWENVARAAG